MSSGVDYTKHLIECNCVLPKYKNWEPPVWHQFIVFSEINEEGNIIPSFAQCNNCNKIHKVTEVGTSTILNKDHLPSLPNLDEVLSSLPPKLQKELEPYSIGLPLAQEILFVFENQKWGKSIVISKEIVEDMLVGKYLQILGNTLWRFKDIQDAIAPPDEGIVE